LHKLKPWRTPPKGIAETRVAAALVAFGHIDLGRWYSLGYGLSMWRFRRQDFRRAVRFILGNMDQIAVDEDWQYVTIEQRDQNEQRKTVETG
jgi:hypothetical protein